MWLLFLLFCVVVVDTEGEDTQPQQTEPIVKKGRKRIRKTLKDGKAGSLRSCGHKEKVVSLTFDDGPRPGQIEKVLEVLQRREVKATFFITIGILLSDEERLHPNMDALVREKPMCSLMRRIVDEGHSIQHHTWTHALFPNLPPEQMAWELDTFQTWYKTCLCRDHNKEKQETISEKACLDPETLTIRKEQEMTIFRAPQGSVTRGNLDYIKSKGYAAVANWNIDTRDWKGGKTEEIKRNFMQAVNRKHVPFSHIVLMHDWAFPEDSTEAGKTLLDIVIDYYQKHSFRFVDILECHTLLASETQTAAPPPTPPPTPSPDTPAPSLPPPTPAPTDVTGLETAPKEPEVVAMDGGAPMVKVESEGGKAEASLVAELKAAAEKAVEMEPADAAKVLNRSYVPQKSDAMQVDVDPTHSTQAVPVALIGICVGLATTGAGFGFFLLLSKFGDSSSGPAKRRGV